MRLALARQLPKSSASTETSPLLRSQRKRRRWLLPSPPLHTPVFTVRLSYVLKTSNFAKVGKIQMDLLSMALTCDLTRVASLQWSTAQSGIRHTQVGADKSHHGLSHEGESNSQARTNLIDIGNWYSKQLAYLADSLSEIDEGGVSLLDSTVIVSVTEISYGFGNKHTYDNMPYVLIGGCGGALKTGRWVDVGGRAHNDLFVTLMKAMDVSGDTFGNPTLNKGPLTTLLA